MLAKFLAKLKLTLEKIQLELALLESYKLSSGVGHVCLAGTAQPGSGLKPALKKIKRAKAAQKEHLEPCQILFSESQTLGFPPQFFHCLHHASQPIRMVTKAPLPASGFPSLALLPSRFMAFWEPWWVMPWAPGVM